MMARTDEPKTNMRGTNLAVKIEYTALRKEVDVQCSHEVRCDKILDEFKTARMDLQTH